MLAKEDHELFIIIFWRLARYERYCWVKFDPFWVYGNNTQDALVNAICVFAKFPMEMPYSAPYILTNPEELDLYDKQFKFYIFFVGKQNEKKCYRIVPAKSVEEAKAILQKAGYVEIYTGHLIKVMRPKEEDCYSCNKFNKEDGADCPKCKKRLAHSWELSSLESKDSKNEVITQTPRRYGTNDICEICGEELSTKDPNYCLDCGHKQGQI